VQTDTTAGVTVGYKATGAGAGAWQTSQASTSSVTTTQMTTTSTTLTTSTTTQAARPPSLSVGQVIYHVVDTTRSPFLATRASSLATDAAVNPVPMNIGLIVGVAVAIAVLLCMLAYVVYKCVVAGQRPAVVAGVVDCAEKTALGVSHDLSPPDHRRHHAPQFAVNGRPPPLLINDSRAKKDVKEWYV